jgi:hypothetical protein
VAAMRELIAAAREATEPRRTAPSQIKPGGVDPLGLRAINFDLMDRVFPGVNNVARHIRPFVVVTWAWRRAAQLAERSNMHEVPAEILQDFVDRIEVIFVWSQFASNPGADLPGRDVLAPILADGIYEFGGAEWTTRRHVRERSTALSAPINYGPATRSLGWLTPDVLNSGALQLGPGVARAIDALEERLRPHLGHEAFSDLGPVIVTQLDVKTWSDAWELEDVTLAEREVMADLLAGPSATAARRNGLNLLVEACSSSAKIEEAAVRRAMCGPPSSLPASEGVLSATVAWRTLQVRQLFRLALEGLFSWCVAQLDAPMHTQRLVAMFLKLAGDDGPDVQTWLDVSPEAGPVELMEELQACVWEGDREAFPAACRRAIALCVAEAPETPAGESIDRLPLAIVARDVRLRMRDSPASLMAHVIEAWVFGQHVYWSVGRGLADARSGRRRLLRLRVVLEEGGWARSPGAQPGVPNATPDRLATMLSLATEAGLVDRP